MQDADEGYACAPLECVCLCNFSSKEDTRWNYFFTRLSSQHPMKMVLVGEQSDAGKRLRSSVRLSDCGKQCALCRAHRDVYNVKCAIYSDILMCILYTLWCVQHTTYSDILGAMALFAVSLSTWYLCALLLSTRCEKAMRELVRDLPQALATTLCHWDPAGKSKTTLLLQVIQKNSNAQTQSFASHHLLLCEIMLGNKPTLLEQLISSTTL